MADNITIPRPVVPFGPLGMTEDQATAHYLREVVRKIDTGFINVGGSNVTATVRKLLADAATALVDTTVSHAEHITVSWAYESSCLEGDCEHRAEDGEPEGMEECPTVPPFDVCVECMVAEGLGCDPEYWDDAPLRPWPCPAALAEMEKSNG